MPKSAIIAISRILITAVVVFGLPYILSLLLNKAEIRTKLRTYRISLIIYIVAILIITLGVRTYDDEIGVITDITWAYRQIFDAMRKGYEAGGIIEAIKRIHWVRGTCSSLILNVLLFVPLGYLLPLNSERCRKRWKVLLAGMAFSLCIETTQYITHLGWFDISDPIYNGLGAWVGYRHFQRSMAKETPEDG